MCVPAFNMRMLLLPFLHTQRQDFDQSGPVYHSGHMLFIFISLRKIELFRSKKTHTDFLWWSNGRVKLTPCILFFFEELWNDSKLGYKWHLLTWYFFFFYLLLLYFSIIIKMQSFYKQDYHHIVHGVNAPLLAAFTSWIVQICWLQGWITPLDLWAAPPGNSRPRSAVA